jgi:hypothetical protein
MPQATVTASAVALLVTLAFGSAPSALALSFTGNLESIKATVAPGQVLERRLQLTLGDEEGARFKVHMEDWWQSEDGRESFYRSPGTLERSCAPWIAVDPVESAAAAGSTLTVRLSARVPREVAPGGYWCVLTLDQVRDPLKAPEGVGIQFLSSISVGVFLEVAPVSRQATIVDVVLDGSRAVVTLRNDGDVPVGAEGWVELVPAEAREPLVKIVLPRVTVLTGPVRQRQLSAPLPSAAELPSGRYLVRAVLDVGLDHYIGVERRMEILRVPASR